MTELNLEYLLELPTKMILSEVQENFERLIRQIRIYLNYEPVFLIYKIVASNTHETFKSNYINFNVSRVIEDHSVKISINCKFKRFCRIILLREAYKCFVPIQLQDVENVNIWINQKVEIDLAQDGAMNEWSEMIRKDSMTCKIQENEFNLLGKWLHLKSTQFRPDPFQFFFTYIRNYIQTIIQYNSMVRDHQRKNLYDLVFEEYTKKYEKYDEKIVESIRIIKQIFYKVKNYHSLYEYVTFFKEFKESGVIQTCISQREFKKNIHWIKDNTSLAPSYRVNWFTLGLDSIWCYMKFHPLLKTSNIYKLVLKIPFFLLPTYLKDGFGVEVLGYFISPKAYFNDIVSFLSKLEAEGILIEKRLSTVSELKNVYDLNYINGTNTNSKHHKKKYALKTTLKYEEGKKRIPLSLFDWALVERMGGLSITGFGFEKRAETLRSLKSDVLDEIQSQRRLIADIKKNLEKIIKSNELADNLLSIIKRNETNGFFYIMELLSIYNLVFEQISLQVQNNPSITKNQLKISIKSSKIIKASILLKEIDNKIIEGLVSLYFSSKKKFSEKEENYRFFFNLFESFQGLKIFNPKIITSIITDKALIHDIYQGKDEKLRKKYEKVKVYNITYQAIGQRLDSFLNNKPPVIIPNIGGSIVGLTSTIASQSILVLKDTERVGEIINTIRNNFPITNEIRMLEYFSNKSHINLIIYWQKLKLKDKQMTISYLRSLFKDDVINDFFYQRSFVGANYTRKDFYDLEKEEFFYTKDLFEEVYKYTQKTLNSEIVPISESHDLPNQGLWSSSKSVQKRNIRPETPNYSINNLYKLQSSYDNLQEILLDKSKFENFKNTNIYKNYIKSIKFIPSFQSFGFGQYFLYFYPKDTNKIDLRHLLNNSFQQIKQPIHMDNSSLFLVSYIWPYRVPNDKILNWLVKSKKVIREYSYNLVKKIYVLFQFNRNLSGNEWNLEPEGFKNYFQSVLFDPVYSSKITDVSHFKLGDIISSDHYSPNSLEYNALTEIYARKPIDIKSYLLTRKSSIVASIKSLLEKNLIFPFFSVKNLGVIGSITIILPNMKKEDIAKVVRIFSFFNIGFIYETEGKYFIEGFEKEIIFENGLMILLYIPQCNTGMFHKYFDEIFTYLEINHYVVLNNLIERKGLLKSIYGDLSFLKDYNPLKNLIWNNKDKIWMNHKLFTKKFDKLYPDMV